MTDTNKLKSLLILNGYNNERFAKAINMSTTAFSKRLNNRMSFSQSEISKIKNVLNLNNEEVVSIFFD